MHLKITHQNRALARNLKNSTLKNAARKFCALQTPRQKRHAKTAYLKAVFVSRSKFCCLNFLARKPACVSRSNFSRAKRPALKSEPLNEAVGLVWPGWSGWFGRRAGLRRRGRGYRASRSAPPSSSEVRAVVEIFAVERCAGPSRRVLVTAVERRAGQLRKGRDGSGAEILMPSISGRLNLQNRTHCRRHKFRHDRYA